MCRISDSASSSASLRDWGLSWQHPFPRKAQDHKRDLISDMLTLYPYLPILLIGDSGQHDPEVYAEVVRQPPGRVRAVSVRNVSPKSARAAEIERRLRAWDTATALAAVAATAAARGGVGRRRLA